MTVKADDTRLLPSIEVNLPLDVAEFICGVALESGTTDDQAASVITVLALRRYLSLPAPPQQEQP